MRVSLAYLTDDYPLCQNQAEGGSMGKRGVRESNVYRRRTQRKWKWCGPEIKEQLDPYICDFEQMEKEKNKPPPPQQVRMGGIGRMGESGGQKKRKEKNETEIVKR